MMKVLVLAGGLPQLELMRRIRDRFEGVEIILADYLDHPAAETYADKFYQKSTLDIQAIETIAREEKVDFLITACTDQALNTVAAVSEKLGLPCYIDSQTGKNVTNKKYMKQRLHECGIPTAKFAIVDSAVERKPEGLEYPLVVKPVDCNSSKGVVKVQDDVLLSAATKNAVGLSRTGYAVVEEYIEGKELTVDAYVHNGKVTVLAISENEKVKNEGSFLIFRTVYPAGISGRVQKRISEVAQQIVDAFHLQNCPMLIQMLYREGQIYVVEFSARTGGGLKYQLIRQVSGVDILESALDATIGESREPELSMSRKYIVNEFMYCHDGVFDHVEGFQELKEAGILESYFVFKNTGTQMGQIASSGDRVAGITVVADSFSELEGKHKEASGKVKAIDSNGQDILHHGLSYPLEYREFSDSLGGGINLSNFTLTFAATSQKWRCAA